MATVNILITSHANTDRGFARVRTAMRNLRQSMNDNFATGGHNAGHSFSTRLRAALTQGFRSMRETGSGLIQGIGDALRAGGSNPYIMAGIAALVATVAPAIGAALAGAITLGFGAAFVGLGVFLLKDNDKVKSAWGKTLKGLKKDFTDAAKPLVPVLTHAADLTKKIGEKFAPAFQKGMEKVAPHLTKFLDKFATGFSTFLDKSFGPMMDAFGGLLDNIDIKGFFENLGGAFQLLAQVVDDNKESIGALFNFLLYMIPIAIGVIAGLAYVWGQIYGKIKTAIHYAKEFWGWLKQMKDKTIHFAQVGLQKIRDWLKNVKDWRDRLKGKAIAFYQKGLQTIKNWISTVKSWRDRLRGKAISFAQRGIGAIISAIRTLKGWINGLKGKVIHIGASISGLARKFIPGFAHGGIIGHAAEGGPRSNTTLVGENGPEFVDLAPGSRVRSNPDSRRLASGGGGGSQMMQITLQIGDKKLGDLLIDPIRKSVRTRGGNVQAVLGG